MNPIRGKLNDHAAKGYTQINAYEHDLQQIYLRARNRIEMQLSTFLQRRNASFTGPRLIGLFDDLNELFPQFEEEYRETYQHALEYMAHQNYAAALQDMGLKESVVGSMNKNLFQNMLQDGFQHIAGATRNMQTEVVSELRRMSARVMREAALTGMTRAEVSRHIASELLYAPDAKLKNFQFIDAGGRHWKTEKYFNMLGRTLLHNNARECYLAGCAKAGNDIVTISVSGDSCDACGKYENALLSITGATPGLPTLEEAMAEGLFHPNCTHRIIAVPEVIARKYYGMGGGKNAGQTGQTSPTRQQAPLVFFGGGKEQFTAKSDDKLTEQGKLLEKQMKKAGISAEARDEIHWNHTPKMQRLCKENPHVTGSSNWPGVEPGTRNIEIGNNPNKPEGCRQTVTHEYGHYVANSIFDLAKTRKFAEFEAAVIADWKAAMGTKRIQRFEGLADKYSDQNQIRDVIAREKFGKDNFSELSMEQQWQINADADTLGSISGGKYGFGHESKVYLEDWYREAFANMYLAHKYNWVDFSENYPSLWKYMEDLTK